MHWRPKGGCLVLSIKALMRAKRDMRLVSVTWCPLLSWSVKHLSELKTLDVMNAWSPLFINLKTYIFSRNIREKVWTATNQVLIVETKPATNQVLIVETKQPIRSREISKNVRAVSERTLIGSKTAGRIKQKIKSADTEI